MKSETNLKIYIYRYGEKLTWKRVILENVCSEKSCGMKETARLCTFMQIYICISVIKKMKDKWILLLFVKYNIIKRALACSTHFFTLYTFCKCFHL